MGTLRTDRGGEFTGRNFTEHCSRHSVQRHLTAPYTPEQNGVVERRNQSVLGMARSMLKAMSMSSWFWGEVVITAVFILNRSPTQSVDEMTPYDVWHGVKPSVSYFRTFGCVAHVKQGSKHLGKLQDRSTMMVFIGYEPGSKAWRFYNPALRRVHVSRDAVFEEDRAWEWCAEDVGDGEPFQVEYVAAGESHTGVGRMAWPEPSPRARGELPGETFTKERGNAHVRV
jgi:transposase InsO family protein